MTSSGLLLQLQKQLHDRLSFQTNAKLPLSFEQIANDHAVLSEFVRYCKAIEVAALANLIPKEELFAGDAAPVWGETLWSLLNQYDVPSLRRNAVILSFYDRITSGKGPADHALSNGRAFAAFSAYYALSGEIESDADAWLWWDRRESDVFRDHLGKPVFVERLRSALLGESKECAENLRQFVGINTFFRFLFALHDLITATSDLPYFRSGVWWHFGRVFNNRLAMLSLTEHVRAIAELALDWPEELRGHQLDEPYIPEIERVLHCLTDFVSNNEYRHPLHAHLETVKARLERSIPQHAREGPFRDATGGFEVGM